MGYDMPEDPQVFPQSASEACTTPMEGAIQSVRMERARQDEKWGVQNLSPDTWLTVLAEEVGELAQAILHTRFGGNQSGRSREEAVQVAAVAVAIVEAIDRGDFVTQQPVLTQERLEEALAAAGPGNVIESKFSYFTKHPAPERHLPEL